MEQNTAPQINEQPFMMLFVEKIEDHSKQVSYPTYAGVTSPDKNDYTDDK